MQFEKIKSLIMKKYLIKANALNANRCYMLVNQRLLANQILSFTKYECNHLSV